MLHRDVLALVDSLEGGPFSVDAKRKTGEAARDTQLCLPDGTPIGEDALLLIWRCVEAARQSNSLAQLSEGELVTTLPIGLPRGTRPTDIVVAEMIGKASEGIVIMGYIFTPESGIMDLLAAAALRGVSVQIVCDRKDGGRERLRRLWPSFAPQPTILVNAESTDALSKMHSKLLIVDRQDVLITSANFTYHGMYGNIELGVRLRSERIGSAANDFVTHLIETEALVPAN